MLDRKGRGELAYWKRQQQLEGSLRGEYDRLFVGHFGFTPDAFDETRMLDVGCGPRGSLEWAERASERIGVDPLAEAYRELGTDNHSMSYVTAHAEDLPFPDDYFDFVSCFNALDHTIDPSQAASEMTRVTAPGGHVLLICDIGRESTPLEPHSFGWDQARALFPALDVVRETHFRAGTSIHLAVKNSQVLQPGELAASPRGVLSSLLAKPGSS